MQDLLEGIERICVNAGTEILKVYEQADFNVETKSDNSPLTAADLAAHRTIMKGLAKLAPGIPVLSEESDEISFETRSGWARYFLVDPLDGTKEFIQRNGEFTVNIALIEDHKPVLGVVHVPVRGQTYAGDVKAGLASKVSTGQSRQSIRCRAMQGEAITVVASRRHGSADMEACMAKLEAQYSVQTLNVGSSLKFCMLAEGKADLYPRLAPTSEWDTAAAQAVVEAAGGQVVDNNFDPLRYNTKENILNPYFYVWADPQYDWPLHLSSDK